MSALVLLPGLDGTGDLFAPLLRELSTDLRPLVVRYPIEPLEYRELVEFALELLPSDETFVILGESFSGPVAISLATRVPERVRGVLLSASFVSSPLPFSPVLSRLVGTAPIRWMTEKLGPSRLMGRFESAEARSLMLNALGTLPDEVLRVRIRAVLSADVSLELRKLERPMLYLQASEDAIVSSTAAAKFARLAQRGRVERIIGPHCLLQCVPAPSARAIERFVGGL
jgi:pimeloyl-[acyl-carrier protein] methyl ester esterase